MIRQKIIWFFQVVFITFSYLILFVLVRNFYSSEIVFYQGNRLIIINSLFWAVLFYVSAKFSFNQLIAKLDIIFTAAILCFAILSTFPVILDRSITLHMLHKLNVEKTVSVKELQADFVENFVYGANAIEKRIIEQVEIGNVSLDGENVIITKKGEKYQVFFEYLNSLFNIKTTYFKDDK